MLAGTRQDLYTTTLVVAKRADNLPDRPGAPEIQPTYRQLSAGPTTLASQIRNERTETTNHSDHDAWSVASGTSESSRDCICRSTIR